MVHRVCNLVLVGSGDATASIDDAPSVLWGKSDVSGKLDFLRPVYRNPLLPVPDARKAPEGTRRPPGTRCPAVKKAARSGPEGSTASQGRLLGRVRAGPVRKQQATSSVDPTNCGELAELSRGSLEPAYD